MRIRQGLNIAIKSIFDALRLRAQFENTASGGNLGEIFSIFTNYERIPSIPSQIIAQLSRNKSSSVELITACINGKC